LGGISGAGMTTAIQQYRPMLTVLTFGLLGGAFYLTYRPSSRTSTRAGAPGSPPVRTARTRMMTFNKITLWVATIAAIFFLAFPGAVTNLFAADDGFTADMERTTVAIEGMT
jgi:hypothetical protein